MTTHSPKGFLSRFGFDRLFERLSGPSNRTLQRIANSAVVLIWGSFFAFCLVVALIAGFGSGLPNWLPASVIEPLRAALMSGNLHVELTIECLVHWGFKEALASVLLKVFMVGGVLIGALIILRQLPKLAMLLPWAGATGPARTEEPRIRLTRPLRVGVNSHDALYLHQFDMNIDIVLRLASDTGSVISGLSQIAAAMLQASSAVIDHANGNVKASTMKKQLTRAARKADKRIRRVELRDLGYVMIERASGEAVFQQYLPTD